MCYSIHGNRSSTRTLKRQKKKTLKTCTFVTIANMNTAAAVVEHTKFCWHYYCSVRIHRYFVKTTETFVLRSDHSYDDLSLLEPHKELIKQAHHVQPTDMFQETKKRTATRTKQLVKENSHPALSPITPVLPALLQLCSDNKDILCCLTVNDRVWYLLENLLSDICPTSWINVIWSVGTEQHRHESTAVLSTLTSLTLHQVCEWCLNSLQQLPLTQHVILTVMMLGSELCKEATQLCCLCHSVTTSGIVFTRVTKIIK